LAADPIEIEFEKFNSWFDPNSYSAVGVHGEYIRKSSYRRTRERFVEEALIRIQDDSCDEKAIGEIEDKITAIKAIKYAFVCRDCAEKIGREKEFESHTKGKEESCFLCKETMLLAEVSMPGWYETCIQYNNERLIELYCILDSYYGSNLEPFNEIFDHNTIRNNMNMLAEVNKKLFTDVSYDTARSCESVKDLFKTIEECKKVGFNRYTALTTHRD